MNNLERRVIKLERDRKTTPTAFIVWRTQGQSKADAIGDRDIPEGATVTFIGWAAAHDVLEEIPQRGSM